MPNHVLRNSNVDVVFAVVDLKSQTDEVWQDGCCAGLGSYWGGALAWWGADYGKTIQGKEGVSVSVWGILDSDAMAKEHRRWIFKGMGRASLTGRYEGLQWKYMLASFSFQSAPGHPNTFPDRSRQERSCR